ncbi:phenazine-specific anthranilate synthase component I [Streptomyces spiroverticillatus]|uniref:anthranilate synthase n=1 Tax=Streptomyces finlayi TaxID=67296 RepID=A0A918X628_9ACTN|nr:chorismate-binding protein [Streptomyces finlayi]GHA30400.1 phenazine-specific anthranilate synthase component I [Streptomyces spiroverticillatus]GHD14867.1 phenazine-specific anthranilate synthase component I [Streptomyces finlayi]
MRPTTDASVLERLYGCDVPPFALLHRQRPGLRERATVELLIGETETVASLNEANASPGAGPGPGLLALLPFRHLSEHGLPCHDDGTPVRVLRVREHHVLPEETFTDRAPLGAPPVEWRDAGFTTSDAQYEELVRRFVDSDAARGGLNVLLRRDWSARLPGFRPAVAVELFRRLLAAESGAYWSFVVHTGGPRPVTLVGATPQGHVGVEGGRVVMNPLCGTYRRPPEGTRAEDLLAFLADRKEAEELATTVDAELAALCALAGPGVRVEGPFLRPMAHLLHTQCRISGPVTARARETLARTLFASTVVGSPFAQACEAIHGYEETGRGYYGGLLALIGRDATGAEELDTAAVIRTLVVDHRGEARLSVGATVGGQSSPESEAAETRTKAQAVLTALTGRPPTAERAGTPSAERARTPAAPVAPVPDRDPALDSAVREALDRRHAALSSFWTEGTDAPSAGGPAVLVLDAGGDAHTELAALLHLVNAVHGPAEVIRHDDRGAADTLVRHPGPVLLASGPGRPDDRGCARMTALRRTAALLVRDRPPGGPPVVGVGLGFQLLALAALPDARVVTRSGGTGLAREVTFLGRPVTAAFRNACTIVRGPQGREVIALHERAVRGVQFRPESVLTTDGAGVLRRLLG